MFFGTVRQIFDKNFDTPFESTKIFGIYSPSPQHNISPQPKRQLLLPLLTEVIFCESVDNAHSSEVSSTFQEADCSLKLVELSKQSVPNWKFQ